MVLGSAQSKGLSATGCGPSLIVMYGLIHGVTPDEYTLAPPSTHQHSGASLLMGVPPDCRS